MLNFFLNLSNQGKKVKRISILSSEFYKACLLGFLVVNPATELITSIELVCMNVYLFNA